MSENKQLQVKEKHEAEVPAEQTHQGPVFSPDVDIFENEKELILLADMPGANTDDLNIDLRDGVLTIDGSVDYNISPEETYVLSEYLPGRYYRQFHLSDVIDQMNIKALMKDGVLRLTLPKAEKAIPRQIAIDVA
jgi:HSP20 family molecular chaperone IbpA